MPKHITKEKKNNIVKYYKTKPMTITDVSKKFGVSNPSVIKVLNEYNVERYSKIKLFSPNLIEDYFENINTEQKAYFLGLIISDGCVHNTKNKQSLVSITLDSNDDYLLDFFKKEIKSNKKITHDTRGCSQISILSNKMVSDLKKYGVCENKSLHTIFPKDIPEHLYCHLIRGLIDGDGSISFYKRKDRKNCHVKAIRFCQGNKKMIGDLVDFL